MWEDHQSGRRSSPAFTDTELTEAIERLTGVRQQRNVIARARGLMCDSPRHPVKDPAICELGRFDVDGRPYTHYMITVAGLATRTKEG